MRSSTENKILNLMYRGTTTIQNFQWDNMRTVPLLSLVTVGDIEYIRKLILSPRYSGNNKYKMKKIDEVMNFRGFARFAGGTNRLVYTHPSAPNAVFKVAIDSVGIDDNPAEYKNQELLKPYCCKVFECSPCGTIASFEKVERITTFEEFYTIADDYFYILSRIILGKYVMEDIGINFFMNVGIRKGCHPVILDFPYLYELDGEKLECLAKLDNGQICHGEIDYDHGFNKLICKKCGREYRARELSKPITESCMFTRIGGSKMGVKIYKNGKLIKSVNSGREDEFLTKPNKKEVKNKLPKITVTRNGLVYDLRGNLVGDIPLDKKVEREIENIVVARNDNDDVKVVKSTAQDNNINPMENADKLNAPNYESVNPIDIFGEYLCNKLEVKTIMDLEERLSGMNVFYNLFNNYGIEPDQASSILNTFDYIYAKYHVDTNATNELYEKNFTSPIEQDPINSDLTIHDESEFEEKANEDDESDVEYVDSIPYWKLKSNHYYCVPIDPDSIDINEYKDQDPRIVDDKFNIYFCNDKKSLQKVIYDDDKNEFVPVEIEQNDIREDESSTETPVLKSGKKNIDDVLDNF